MSLEEALHFSGGKHELIDGQTVITGGNIGLNDYPIFDEAHRQILNAKIFDRYRHAEIGNETLSMFQWQMRSRMNEIMPHFNKLYEIEIEMLGLDKLSTVNMETDSEATSTGETETTGEASNTVETTSEVGSGSRNVSSTTPQVMLSGSGDYASAAADVTGQVITDTEAADSSENSEMSSSASASDTKTVVKGYQGYAPELLARYRELLLDIDTLVIDSLQDMFMLLWGNNDAYVENRNFYLGY